MLTNQVDTTRRGIYVAGLSIEVLDETASYKLNIQHVIYNLTIYNLVYLDVCIHVLTTYQCIEQNVGQHGDDEPVAQDRAC